MMLDFEDLRQQPTTIWIRHCVMNCSLQVAGPAGQNATVVIEENLFHDSPAAPFDSAPDLGRLVIRRNIMTTHGPSFEKVNGRSLSIELSNNTILGPTSQFSFAAPPAAVTVYNNIIYWNLYFVQMSAAERDASIKSWDFGWNAFFNHNRQPGVGLPRLKTDFADDPRFLSLNPKHADYLRVAADSPLGTAGAGGEWPKHIGALPPGPAPPDGDWFTRLRERWLAPNGPAGNPPGG
jgi:hypothetical protein